MLRNPTCQEEPSREVAHFGTIGCHLRGRGNWRREKTGLKPNARGFQVYTGIESKRGRYRMGGGITQGSARHKNPLPARNIRRGCQHTRRIGQRTDTARLRAGRRIHRSAPLERATAIRIILPSTVGLRTHQREYSILPGPLVKRVDLLVRERSSVGRSDLVSLLAGRSAVGWRFPRGERHVEG
jgi:hypothetical protein